MTATVDPATGNVTINANGNPVNGWAVRSAGGIFTGDAANIDPGFPTFDTDTDNEVSTGFISLTGTNDLGGKRCKGNSLLQPGEYPISNWIFRQWA